MFEWRRLGKGTYRLSVNDAAVAEIKPWGEAHYAVRFLNGTTGRVVYTLKAAKQFALNRVGTIAKAEGREVG